MELLFLFLQVLWGAFVCMVAAIKKIKDKNQPQSMNIIGNNQASVVKNYWGFSS